MTTRGVRLGATVVYVAAFLATTWPGLLFVNRVDPKILGLPFHMAWIAGWIVVVFVTLLVVDRVESADDVPGSDRGEGAG